MNKRYFLLFLLILFTAASLHARGKKEKENVPEVQVTGIIQVTGIVRLVGNSPLTEIVITNPDGEWHIAKEEKDKLHSLQHQTVTVEGEETVAELRFASGMPAGIRRDLRNIKIIEVK
jgi:hypothetical protein